MTELEILSDALAEKINADLLHSYRAGELDFVPTVYSAEEAIIKALYYTLCQKYDNDADAIIQALERARARLGG